jgi:hypothetical protein
MLLVGSATAGYVQWKYSSAAKLQDHMETQVYVSCLANAPGRGMALPSGAEVRLTRPFAAFAGLPAQDGRRGQGASQARRGPGRDGQAYGGLPEGAGQGGHEVSLLLLIESNKHIS